MAETRAGDSPSPVNLYGATKAWAEALGAWLAATTSTSVVALRIGYFAEQRPDPATVPAREMSAWLSPRDAADLVRVAVEATGSNFVVANGISTNRYRVADLHKTMQQLSYRPVDDAGQLSRRQATKTDSAHVATINGTNTRARVTWVRSRLGPCVRAAG